MIQCVAESGLSYDTLPLASATGCHPGRGRGTQELLFRNAGNSLGDQTMRGTLRLFPAVHPCRLLRSKNAWRGSNSSARQRSADEAACTRDSCSFQDASLGLAIWVWMVQRPLRKIAIQKASMKCSANGKPRFVVQGL
jgi:hypothetical protein